MKTEVYYTIARDLRQTTKIISGLLGQNCWFMIEPWPSDEWMICVKTPSLFIKLGVPHNKMDYSFGGQS